MVLQRIYYTVRRKRRRMMSERFRSIKESRLPWFLFYIGLSIELLIVIIDKSNYINPVEGLLFRITFLFFAFKLLLTDYSIKEWCVIVLLEAVAFVSYRITGANDLIRLVTFVVACKNIPFRQMLKYTFYVTFAGCVAIILLSVTGIYGEVSLTQAFGHEAMENTLYIDVEPAKETRYTLGMGHPNALSCMFLMLVVLGVYVWFAQMKWYGYLLIMLLNVGVYILTESKTGLLITTIFLLGACALNYCEFLRKKAFIYVCGLIVFVLCVGFSVDAAVYAQRVRDAQWNAFYYLDPRDNKHIVTLGRIDRVLTGRIISLTNTERNDGMIQTWSAFSNPDHMDYYFDMGWVKLFYRYGVVPGILYIVACFTLLWRMYKKKDACGLLLFATLAVYTVIEAHLVSVYLGRNFLLMMMGYYLTGADSVQDASVSRL